MSYSWMQACVLGAFVLLAPSPGQTRPVKTVFWADDVTGEQRQKLERFADRLEDYRNKLSIPGMSVGVVKDGELTWAQGFGYADIENKVPATPQTPYHLASLTKTFASQVLMKLVEEGKIDLDDPVEKYGVEIKGDTGITIRHLFTHTAEGRPGSRYKYNGHLFSYLGQVVERAAGRPFVELALEQIIEPTGMRNTAPVLGSERFKAVNVDPNTIRVNEALAKPYALDKAKTAIPGGSPNPDHLGVSTGLISTVVDMARYDAAVDNNAFISKASQELAWTAAISNGNETLPYGLGWFVQEYSGSKLVWHYGWEVDYSALILKLPEENVTLILLANGDYLSRPFGLGDGDVLGSPFAVEFLKTVALPDRFGEPAPVIDYALGSEAIAAELENVNDPNLKELLRRELIGNLVLHHNMDRIDIARDHMKAYIDAFTGDHFGKLGDLPVIATIDNVADNQYRTVEFELPKDTPVRVYAVGEGGREFMFDYGGIENAHNGQIVWEMYNYSTEHAGGAMKNRKFDRIVPLPAGVYRLHYRTDESHSFEKWNDLPPDHYWWGIRLFDASGSGNTDALETFWSRANRPEELGWSSKNLDALRFDLETTRSSAFLVVTDGKIVFEWGRTASNIFSHSTRKSLLSVLYGIYVNRGRIDTSWTLGDLGIVERVELTDSEKQAKVVDLLKARSGVYIPAAAETVGMSKARPKRGSHPSGAHWYYNNWDFNVLGTIFRNQTGEDLYEAFAESIGRPIGMQDYVPARQEYHYERNFSIHPAYPIRISARDMARLGQLLLQHGKWNGRQLVPAEWIAESTASYSKTDRSQVGYGYMWWIVTEPWLGLEPGDYYASGYGGQKLFVLPRINTVIVHRNNIYLPGVSVGDASAAPFHLLPKILSAHTGRRAGSAPAATHTTTRKTRLLPDYVHIQRAHGADYSGRRITLWGCACVFLSWGSARGAQSLVRRIRRHKPVASGNALGLGAVSPLTTVLGLVCALYLVAILPGNAVEYTAVYGLPRFMPAHIAVIRPVPLLGAFGAALIVPANLFVWSRKRWSLPTRLHLSVFTFALLVFVWMCCSLNLMPSLV